MTRRHHARPDVNPVTAAARAAVRLDPTLDALDALDVTPTPAKPSAVPGHVPIPRLRVLSPTLDDAVRIRRVQHDRADAVDRHLLAIWIVACRAELRRLGVSLAGRRAFFAAHLGRR